MGERVLKGERTSHELPGQEGATPIGGRGYDIIGGLQRKLLPGMPTLASRAYTEYY